MYRILPRIRIIPSPSRLFSPNCCAAFILLAAFGTLAFFFEPKPAGAHLAGTAFKVPQLEAQSAPIAQTAALPAGQSTTAASATPAQPPVMLQGKAAVMLHLGLLRDGKQKLEEISDYTTTFFKQERLDGDLSEGQAIQMKLRHKPLSIYMKWLTENAGQEVLYVDGQNDNQLLVKKGGRAAVFPAVSVDPNGRLALAEARYPITTAGLLPLIEKLAHYREKDLQRLDGISFRMDPMVKFNDRPCYSFTAEYKSAEVEELYRKSIIFMDEELSMPVYVKNYTWKDAEAEPVAEGAAPTEDDTLIEYYTFSDIRFNTKLAEKDFDRENKNYKFRR